MSNELLLGLLPNSSSAESAVNDCVEAGVSEHQISILMQDEATARAIANDAGPLRGTTAAELAGKLTSLGVSPSDAQTYTGGVASGQALIALSIGETWRDGATEVLRGLQAQHVATFNASRS